MLGNVNTSSALSAFEKMEEKGSDCHFFFFFSDKCLISYCMNALSYLWKIFLISLVSTICCHSTITLQGSFKALYPMSRHFY